MYIMDSIRSNNVLNLDTESLLQINCEIKHNFQSHEANKNQSNHNTNSFPGKYCCSKPHYLLFYIQHGYMKQLNTTLILTSALLYSANCLTLSQIKLTNT